jgi:hypothetical protein
VVDGLKPDFVLAFVLLDISLILVVARLVGSLASRSYLPVGSAFSGLRTDFTSLGWAWIPGILLFLLAGVIGEVGRRGAVGPPRGGFRSPKGTGPLFDRFLPAAIESAVPEIPVAAA